MARKPYIDETLDEAIEMSAVLAVEDLWATLMQAALDQYAALSRLKMAATEIARQVGDFVEGLSTKPQEGLARQSSSVAYGSGRGSALKEASRSGEVRFAVWTEMMDTDTCIPCWNVDLTVDEIGGAEYARFETRLHCAGRKNCRGFHVGLEDSLLNRKAA